MRFGKRGLDASQIEDRRGMGGGRGAAIGGGGLGIGGLLIVLLFQALGGGGGGFGEALGGAASGFPAAAPADAGSSAAELASDDTSRFVTLVTNDVQAHWTELFAQAGEQYPETKLVLFEEGVQTGGCGSATSATGPFYCPADSKVYLDLGFFQELRTRFGAPGDFAQAYVIAHEFGHHIQNVLGISSKVRQEQQQDADAAAELSVRLELQADCLAGVWAYSAYRQGELSAGDLDEGLEAAAAVGDDRIQEQAGQRVDESRFTHGSSEQRKRWFSQGYETGRVADCDTYQADEV